MEKSLRYLFVFCMLIISFFLMNARKTIDKDFEKRALVMEIIKRDSTSQWKEFLDPEYKSTRRIKSMSKAELKSLFNRKRKRAFFGQMDIVDFESVSSPAINHHSSTACAIFYLDGNYNALTEDGSLIIKKQILENDFCESVPFKYQSRLSAGTAFVLNDSSVCTAAHYSFYNEKNIVFVMNYLKKDSITDTIPAIRVLKPVAIIKESRDFDFIVFKINRKLEVVPEIGTPEIGQDVYMVGHPYGWPLKYTHNAEILGVSSENGNWWLTDIDNVNYSSGSPVFDAKNHKLIGMQIRGSARSFETSDSCRYYFNESYSDIIASIFVDINAILR